MRAEIKSVQQRFNDDLKMKALLEEAATLDKKIAPVEEQLIQVNMKGSEANLAFPNMLNEQLDSLAPLCRQETARRHNSNMKFSNCCGVNLTSNWWPGNNSCPRTFRHSTRP
jgi:seryl-tRNA synthetase